MKRSPIIAQIFHGIPGPRQRIGPVAETAWAEKNGATPLARLVSCGVGAVEPGMFGLGPVPAICQALERAGWRVGDLDRGEINEAFAAIAVALVLEIGLEKDSVNVEGGAIAHGHPIGATGTVLTTRLLHGMERDAVKRGLVTFCIGGIARIAMTASVRVLVILLMALAVHLVEVGLYAVAYAPGDWVPALGSFGGFAVTEPLGYPYFSITSYTSLGLGEVFPSDRLRFIAGVEALNGLLLIVWSGSFIFIAMGRLRPWQTCVEPARATDSMKQAKADDEI